MEDFAECLSENELSNEITGSEDGDILIEVHYDPDEKQAIYELLEIADSEEEED